MARMASLIIGWLWRWIQKYIEQIVCTHFCKFKGAGSDLKYTHVHIYVNADDGVNGVGHDDHTPVSDPHHTTISKGNKCDFTEKKGEMGGKPAAYFHTSGSIMTTAYFHPCDEKGECPSGYTKIKCKCECGEDKCEEVCVCYTLNHDNWQRWYDEQKWTSREGTYQYPSVNIRGRVPTSIKCGSSIILRYWAMESVKDYTGYDKATDNNPLIKEARKELKKAADKIKCDGNCQKSVTEVFKGCKYEKSGSGYLVEAMVQWEVERK
ncbi:hypothetical protein ACFLW6_03345 [Chloroflexota bacterium]